MLCSTYLRLKKFAAIYTKAHRLLPCFYQNENMQQIHPWFPQVIYCIKYTQVIFTLVNFILTVNKVFKTVSNLKSYFYITVNSKLMHLGKFPYIDKS